MSVDHASGERGIRLSDLADVADLCTRFAAALHHSGLTRGAERIGRFAEAIIDLRPSTLHELRWIARATLTSSLAERSRLDAVFDQVFGGRFDDATRGGSHTPLVPSGIEPGTKQAPQRRDPPNSASSPQSKGGSPTEGDNDANDDATESERETVAMTASGDERLRAKDFGSCSTDELLRLARMIADLRLQPPHRQSHRRRRSTSGAHHDLRRTLRNARSTGGDPIRLARKARVERPRKVILLADVSGSMERYARAYLYLLHASVRALDAEAFLFATRLTRATSVLRQHSPEIALQRAAMAAEDWSGGTRIGEALRAFLDGWGRRGLARGAVIVVISDGWEGGDPGLLREQMARMSLLAARIVWVNPRKQRHDYQPLVAGMAGALPFVDSFVSGHSYDAMREVIAAISGTLETAVVSARVGT